MKPFTSLTLLMCILLVGSAYSQDVPARPEGPNSGPNRTPDRPAVPRAVTNSKEFQAWTADFRKARDDFRTRLQQMRASLVAASEAEKDGIRNQIREQMKRHRQEQIAFRKKVRGLMEEVREAGSGDSP